MTFKHNNIIYYSTLWDFRRISSYSHDRQYDLDGSSLETNVFTPPLSYKAFIENGVLRALQKIKPKTTMEPNRNPAFILRDCETILAAPLTLLFILSLQNCLFPSFLEKSRIVQVIFRPSLGITTFLRYFKYSNISPFQLTSKSYNLRATRFHEK